MEVIISTSKGTHLLSWHRRDSCIQWCLEWAVAWIEVTSEDVLLQASSTHSLSERTGALSFGGWNDADFSNMGKGCLIPVKHFLCVWKKSQWYFSKDYEIWIARSVWITFPLFVVVVVVLWTVIYVSQCKKCKV